RWASAWTTGFMARHGGHQDAQKSTSTGSGDSSTSFFQLNSLRSMGDFRFWPRCPSVSHCTPEPRWCALRSLLELLKIRPQVFGLDVLGAQVAPANPFLAPLGDRPLVVINQDVSGIVPGIGPQGFVPYNDHRIMDKPGPPVRAFCRQGRLFQVI